GAVLPRESPVREQAFLDVGRSQVIGPAQALPYAACGRQGDVDAGEVHELEWTEREIGIAHRLVDRLDRRLAGFEQAQRLDREGPIDAIDDEARGVGAANGCLAPSPDDVLGAGDDLRGGQGSWHDL